MNNNKSVSSELIDNFQSVAGSLLESRQKTLSLYNDIMASQPFEENDLLRELLEDFCEQLVDYSGKIHFHLLNQLQNGIQDDSVQHQAVNKSTAYLVENTQKILDFQDSHNSDVKDLDMAALKTRLSQVGEVIADRVALEDKLLDTFS